MVGRCLGRYRLLAEIGSGGMGRVYRARDERTGEDVALKLLLAEGVRQRFIRRMKREAQALARLDHPNIVRFHGFFAKAGELYFVMDFVDGPTLADRVRERWEGEGAGFAVDEALAIGRDLASALVHAHEQRIWHRDLKPENVLLHGDGRAILTDFGLAKVEDLTALTAQGRLLGTVLYLAPEQMLGQTVDGRADLYQLALMLYEMLTGELPLAEGNAVLSAQRRLQEAIPPPSGLRPELPPWLDAFLLRNLEVDRRRRDGDAETFLAGLFPSDVELVASSASMPSGLPSPVDGPAGVPDPSDGSSADGSTSSSPTAGNFGDAAPLSASAVRVATASVPAAPREAETDAVIPGDGAPSGAFREAGGTRRGTWTRRLLAVLAGTTLLATGLGSWWLVRKEGGAVAASPPRRTVRRPPPTSNVLPGLRLFTLFVEDGELAGGYEGVRVGAEGEATDRDGAGWLRLHHGALLPPPGEHWIDDRRGLVRLGGRRIVLGLSGGNPAGRASESSLVRPENVELPWSSPSWREEAPGDEDPFAEYRRAVERQGDWSRRHRFKRRDMPWDESFPSRPSGPERLFAEILAGKERGGLIKLFGAGRRISPTLVLGDVHSRCPSVGLYVRRRVGGGAAELGVLPPLTSLEALLRFQASAGGDPNRWADWRTGLPVTFSGPATGEQHREGLSGASLLGRLAYPARWLMAEVARGERDARRFLELVARPSGRWRAGSGAGARSVLELFPSAADDRGTGAIWAEVATRIRGGGRVRPDEARRIWDPVEAFLRDEAAPAFLELAWTRYREIATDARSERPFNEHGLLLRHEGLPRPEDCACVWDGLGATHGPLFRRLFGPTGQLPGDLDELRRRDLPSSLPLLGPLHEDLRGEARALLPSRLAAWCAELDLEPESGEAFLTRRLASGSLSLVGWHRIRGKLVLPACAVSGKAVIVADELRIDGDLVKAEGGGAALTLVSLATPVVFGEGVRRVEARLVSCAGRQTLPRAPFFLLGGLAVRRLDVESLWGGGMRDIGYDPPPEERP